MLKLVRLYYNNYYFICMLKGIFNFLIKLWSENAEFSEKVKFIKTITNDPFSVCRQNSFMLLSLKNRHNDIMNIDINKTIKMSITLEDKTPQLKLKEVEVITKENKIIR